MSFAHVWQQLEKQPYLGRTSQLYKYFPKLCFLACGLEVKQRCTNMNPSLTTLTMADVIHIEGEAGNYKVDDRIANVVTNVEFERMADPLGSTGGRILCPPIF